jgi:hypothetical protein
MTMSFVIVEDTVVIFIIIITMVERVIDVCFNQLLVVERAIIDMYYYFMLCARKSVSVKLLTYILQYCTCAVISSVYDVMYVCEKKYLLSILYYQTTVPAAGTAGTVRSMVRPPLTSTAVLYLQ